MKINTPFQYTFLTSLVSSLIIVCSLFIVLEFYFDKNLSLDAYFLLFIIVFLLIGLVVYFLLEIFINRKIRLLYRMIHNYKMSKADLKISMKDDIFYATETEILRWAKKNRSELVKLKKDERFRREFIGNLAHELKTPIFSIQGYILTLLEGGLEDESVNRKFLNRALNGVERMNKIISDLDMITKFESEKIPLEFRNYDIVEICKEIFESLELKAKENKVRLSFTENYDRPIMVKCDKSRIEQVILNLVMNAINYTSANCDIIIRFSTIDSNVLIEVEDNGPGISEKDLPRLFERFYRVDKSRARNVAGSGLGLSIVKHIIEAHGHRIQVRSTIGKGSTFFFSLSKV